MKEKAKPVAPTGEGLLEESEMHLIYTKAKDYSSGLRAVRDAQAALTAGRMIEEIEREIAGHSNFRPDSLLWRSFKSRYGGKG